MTEILALALIGLAALVVVMITLVIIRAFLH